MRERGVAYDRQERLPGLRCVAAPVPADRADAVAAVGVSGPATRVEGDPFHEVVPALLLSAANAVESNTTTPESRRPSRRRPVRATVRPSRPV